MHRHLLALVLLSCAGLASAAEIAITSGQKLAFLGDSITQFGWQKPSGYVNEVVSGLASAGITVTPIPAGVSGHKSNEMLARLERDVLAKKPDWMTLSCGVNDVWHGPRGVPLEDYKKNITAILDACAKAGVKVMILTATPIQEKLDNDLNGKLAPYNEFLRATAKERGLPLADLYADLAAAITAKGKDSPPLTVDGVHMANAGNMVMATGVLRAFGLSEEQLKAAAERWQDTPGTVTEQKVKLALSLRQYARVEAAAAAAGKPVEDWLGERLTKDLEPVVAAPAK